MLDGTYSGLTATAASWLNRSDLTAQIPDFVVLAESIIERDLILRGGVRRMTTVGAFTISAEFVAVPADFAGVRSFKISGYPALGYAGPDEMAYLKMGPTFHGRPTRYGVSGANFELYRVPDQSYAASLTYYQRLPALVTYDNNWLLTNHPQVYLYGTLGQAEAFLKNDDRIATWKALYDQALGDLIAADGVETYGSTATVRRRTFG